MLLIDNKKYICFLLVGLLILILPHLCKAQPPTIDSVSVDEAKGELIVYGDFGTPRGAVFVDSLSLPITYWSDSLCRATIPVSGKGSAGIVEISGRSYRGKGRMLSSIKPYRHSEQYQNQPPFSTGFDNVQASLWHFRVDIESRVAKRIPVVYMASAPDSKKYNSNYSIDEQHKEQYHADTTTITEIYSLDVYNRIINYPETAWYQISSLDSEYRPLDFYDETNRAHSHGTPIDKGDWGSTFLPRPEYFHLTFMPTAFPKDSDYFGNDSIRLSWTVSSPELEYEVQISKDSLFQQIILDQTVSGKSFLAQNLGNGKYFWRIRVITSVGEGRWSNVPRFQYSLKNGVKNQLSFGYSVYPNPLSTRTTFSFRLPQEESATLKIYNPLGKEVTSLTNQRLEAGDQRIEFDASHLPSGVYYYRLQIGEHIETKPMIVAH